MSPAEADDLARRITATWNGGPDLDTWAEELADLDAGTAGTTLIRLRRELERAPSIARFIATYRGLHTVATDPTPETRCRYCDDSGWVEAPDLIVGDGDHQRTYTQVDACHACAEGRQRGELQARHWPARSQR